MRKTSMAKDQKLAQIIDSINSGDLDAEVDGMHPWSYAIANKSQSLIESLVENGRINEVFEYREEYSRVQYSPLRMACGKWSDIAEYLLEHKANVESHDRFSFSPLLTAAQHGDEKLVELLIEHKADVNADINYIYPINEAVRAQNFPVILALIKNGVHIESRVVHEIFCSAMGSGIESLRVVRILAEHEGYEFDNPLRGCTILNVAMSYTDNCNKWFATPPSKIANKQMIELTSKVLILVANNPKMTDSLVEQAVEWSQMKSDDPKIQAIFTPSFFQEHPYWSIYRSGALLAQLTPEAQALSAENLQRSIELKAVIDKTLVYFPHELANIILGYRDNDSLDFAAANHFEMLAGQLTDEGAGAASSSAYEG